MTKNPFINALAAATYICLVASIMYYGTRQSGPADSVVIPIAVLSLFTLSAAVMGYLFVSQPLRMYVDGEKQRAVTLFLHTVAVFAGITALALLALFSGIVF